MQKELMNELITYSIGSLSIASFLKTKHKGALVITVLGRMRIKLDSVIFFLCLTAHELASESLWLLYRSGFCIPRRVLGYILRDFNSK